MQSFLVLSDYWGLTPLVDIPPPPLPLNLAEETEQWLKLQILSARCPCFNSFFCTCTCVSMYTFTNNCTDTNMQICTTMNTCTVMCMRTCCIRFNTIDVLPIYNTLLHICIHYYIFSNIITYFSNMFSILSTFLRIFNTHVFNTLFTYFLSMLCNFIHYIHIFIAAGHRLIKI